MLENQAPGMLRQEDNDFQHSLSCTVEWGEKGKDKILDCSHDYLPSEC